MGMYKYIRDLYKTPAVSLGEVYRARLLQVRREPATVRLERPTRIDRARSLGYKAKQGFVMVRQRVSRGGRMREKIMGGRRSKNRRRRKIVAKNYQRVAEERVQKKYPNCEVLNSYLLMKDGMSAWYEVIMVDKDNPNILADKDINWIASQKHTGRVYRGLTSAGKKSRGLRNKGKGAEKVRPSVNANKGRLH